MLRAFFYFSLNRFSCFCNFLISVFFIFLVLLLDLLKVSFLLFGPNIFNLGWLSAYYIFQTSLHWVSCLDSIFLGVGIHPTDDYIHSY